MDMNKYLLVAFYVVAGCTVVMPAEGFAISNNSHHIWVELNTIIEENQILLNDILKEKDEPASIATLRSCIHKILSSFYVLDNHSDFACFQLNEEMIEYELYQKPYVKRHKNPSIQVRAPDFV
jgi:hypothetical protein